jgi:hypothetical protein
MTAPLADQNPQHRYDVYERYPIQDSGTAEGWLYYSIVLLSIAGFLNAIGGIAAIGDSHFFVKDSHYVAGDLNTWGWVISAIGVAQLLTALGIYSRNQAARWIGVIALSLNAIAMLMMLDAYPLWALAIFALDVVAIYGLIVHGQRLAPR